MMDTVAEYEYAIQHRGTTGTETCTQYLCALCVFVPFVPFVMKNRYRKGDAT